MGRTYTSIEQLIGHTPLLALVRTQRQYQVKAKLFGKMECFNATGSVKDRVALKMIDDAEERGLLKPGGTIIEPTSGNTGIGLCAVGVARGYKVIIVMPDTMSVERRKLMKAYGGELVLSPGEKGMAGAIAKASELKEKTPGSFIPDQFSNPANAMAHYETTGPEIWNDTEGHVDILVAGVGTGGTISGIGRYLKEQNPKVKVIAVEPAYSAVLSGKESHSHGIQGIGAGFIPAVLDQSVYDEIIPVSDEDAFAYAKAFGKTEGILAGISAGAALCAAVTAGVRTENEGKTMVVIMPDGGDRYLSTAMFEE